MWIVIIAVTMTILLFWKKVSFPVQKRSEVTSTYTIIIPARNEEKNLKRLLSSILAVEDSKREVIVVDDDSEDRTSATAEAFGVRVITNPPLPGGWMGKSWACYNGAKASSGRTLCFLDADTWFSPNGTGKVIQSYENVGRQGVMTIHPYHHMNSFSEKLSGVFHLVVFASSGITSIVKEMLGVQGGFGPCMVIDKDTYWQLEGHDVIRHEVVEHLAFVRHAQKKGIKAYAFTGKDVVNMRMYNASLSEVIAGWSKSFASGAKTASSLMSIANIVWITVILSFIFNLPEIGWWGLVGYFGLTIWLYRTWKEIGNFQWYDALLFPIHFLFFAGVFAYSLLSTFLIKQSTWKGRPVTGKKRGSS